MSIPQIPPCSTPLKKPTSRILRRISLNHSEKRSQYLKTDKPQITNPLMKNKSIMSLPKFPNNKEREGSKSFLTNEPIFEIVFQRKTIPIHTETKFYFQIRPNILEENTRSKNALTRFLIHFEKYAYAWSQKPFYLQNIPS